MVCKCIVVILNSYALKRYFRVLMAKRVFMGSIDVNGPRRSNVIVLIAESKDFDD